MNHHQDIFIDDLINPPNFNADDLQKGSSQIVKPQLELFPDISNKDTLQKNKIEVDKEKENAQSPKMDLKQNITKQRFNFGGNAKHSLQHHDQIQQNSHYFGVSQLSNHSWFDSQAEELNQNFINEKNMADLMGEQCAKAESENQMKTVVKNQTKNIPKNYGKAIIAFIEKQPETIGLILEKYGIQYEDFFGELLEKKKTINTIANLRDLWIDFKYAKCFRMITNQFLRKHALNYIFNSRISNYNSHVKYRKRLQQAVEAPEMFKHIKQY